VSDAQTNSTTDPAGALRFVAAALIVRGGEVLIGQRRPISRWPRSGSFPAARSSPAKALKQALARELDEELGIKAVIGPRVTHIRHNYRHGGAVDLQFFAVHEFSGEIVNRIYHEVRWTKLEDLPAMTSSPPIAG
jgi:8-oxo-dGTP diphosphatase